MSMNEECPQVFFKNVGYIYIIQRRQGWHIMTRLSPLATTTGRRNRTRMRTKEVGKQETCDTPIGDVKTSEGEA